MALSRLGLRTPQQSIRVLRKIELLTFNLENAQLLYDVLCFSGVELDDILLTMVLELLVLLVIKGDGISLAHADLYEVLDNLGVSGVLLVEMVWSAELIFNVMTLFWTIEGGKRRFEHRFIEVENCMKLSEKMLQI